MVGNLVSGIGLIELPEMAGVQLRVISKNLASCVRLTKPQCAMFLSVALSTVSSRL